MNDQYQHILKDWQRDRHDLVPLLMAVQKEATFLSQEAIREIGQHVGLTDNEVYSVASFYPIFRFSPQTNGERDKSRLNAAELPGDETAGMTPDDRQTRVALRNCGLANPEDINDYLARGGYGGFAKVLDMSPGVVEAQITQSGLAEENGADLCSAGRWRQCRQADAKTKYLIVQAAPVDPVSLIDRYLLENDPHAVLEGMLITAYGSGATHGIVYVDGQYSRSLSLLEKARHEMDAAGYLGDHIQGSEFCFDVRILAAAGPVAYGDTEKLISALEGRRPMDCPSEGVFGETGLQGFPTAMHTVEAMASLSAVLEKGADWYAGLGRDGHQGTKILTLAGRVRRTGLVELPMGISVREIIEDFGDGACEGQSIKAVQVGGLTGGWLGADALDVPLDYQAMAAAGIALGSGSLIATTLDSCAVGLSRQALAYAQAQSCGHCLFCREGTRQMAQILADIAKGMSKPGDLDLLEELAAGLKLNASCNLGRTAPDAFVSTVRQFPNEYDAHIKEKRCVAGVCRDTH